MIRIIALTTLLVACCGCATSRRAPHLDTIQIQDYSLRAGSVYDGVSVLRHALADQGPIAKSIEFRVVPSRHMRLDGWMCFDINDTISLRKTLNVLCELADCTWTLEGNTVTIKLKPGVVQQATDPRWQGKDPSNNTSEHIP